MSIMTFRGSCPPVCDICGDELPGKDDFYDAVDAKKEAGWQRVRVGGEWEDVCVACQEGGL